MYFYKRYRLIILFYHPFQVFLFVYHNKMFTETIYESFFLDINYYGVIVTFYNVFLSVIKLFQARCHLNLQLQIKLSEQIVVVMSAINSLMNFNLRFR